MEDFPIHQSDAESWCCLFDKDEQTPLQKLMITVNAGHAISKKIKRTNIQKRILHQLGRQLQQNCDSTQKMDQVSENLNLIVTTAQIDKKIEFHLLYSKQCKPYQMLSTSSIQPWLK
jgi:hypothetical protein